MLPTTAAYLTNDLRPISIPEHCKKPEIELIDASVASCRINSHKCMDGRPARPELFI